MPVANLQSYRAIGLRVRSSAFAAQGQAMWMEQSLVDKLRRQCGFESVGRADAVQSDLVLDLNITNSTRGGNGIISNQNQANIDTLLVLTDGQSGDVLGTARIHGSSSGMIINGAAPENEALDEIAKSVAGLLAKSGCSGPRVAKAEPPAPTPTPTPTPTPGGQGSATGSAQPAAPDETHRAEADAFNDQGRDKLQRADLAGALAAFQQANTLVPDARYAFNICLTYEAQEQWDNAIAACKQARAMNPNAKLASKIDHRLDLLAHRQ